MSIESLVNDCLVEHEGGEKFFDAIDEKLRNDNILMTMMISKILEKEYFDYLIVSGRFGIAFKDFCSKNIDQSFKKSIITINGGLREGKITTIIDTDLNNKNIVFVDDSFYLGRTRDKINDLIKSKNGNLTCTYVFYDGSRKKDDSVHSFYRYYDNFDD